MLQNHTSSSLVVQSRPPGEVGGFTDRGSSMAKLFFSYSHDDEQYRDQLEKHLAPLQN
jgi:hypothetical protein